MKRLLVAGSRTFDKWTQAKMSDLLSQASYCLDRTFDTVIHGGARGVDRMAGAWAEGKGYPVEVYPARWDEHPGKSAGYVRNAEMVKLADAAIIIWDGWSSGTQHTLTLCQEKGIPFVLVVRRP